MNNAKRILLIDDELKITRVLAAYLAKEGYQTAVAHDGNQASRLLQTQPFDLILLDLMLPDISGEEICKIIRRKSRVPIIMLTAKTEEEDILKGLNIGADDYITKPFSPKVLLARIRTVLRRKARQETDDTAMITHDSLTIDPARHQVAVDGEAVDLTATEYRVLHFLARRAGWVFTRQQIVDAVKGEDYPVTERSVDVQMVGLRKKLGDCADMIETVRGIGYRFRE